MNLIWSIIIIVSLFFTLLSGSSKEVLKVLLDTPKESLESVIKIGSLLIFYSGLFQMAIDSGVIKKVSKIFKKFVLKIFPNISKESEVIEYISMNIIANILGLGIASTPIALKVFSKLKEISKNKNFPSKEMIIFLCLNISSFTFFPLTLISIREIYKAKINLQLVPFIILITFLTTIIAVTIVKVFVKDNE